MTEKWSDLWNKASHYKHFGKFEGELNIAQYFYVLSLDGSGDEYGDCSTMGWHSTLLKGPFEVEPDDIKNYNLNDADVEIIKNLYGVVITQNDQGFVIVNYAEYDYQYEEFIEDAQDGETRDMEGNEFYES